MADKKISALTSASTPLAGTEVLPIVQSGSTVKVAVSSLTAGREVTASKFTTAGTAATPAQFLLAGGTTTAFNYGRIANTGGDLWVGLEGSTGGDLFGGTSPYDSVFGTVNTTNLHLAGGAAGIKLEHSTANVIVKTGNLVIGTAAKGIDFSANTGAAGMTSELLDWYEEGTWTPNQGGGLTVVGAFSSSGKYTRIGQQITVTGQVNGATSVLVSASGIISTNLPYASGIDTLGVATDSALSVVGGVFVSAGSANLFATVAIGATPTIYFQVTYFV